MWRKHEAKSQERPGNLLKDLCGDDAELYDCLTNNMYENPTTAIPQTNLDILTDEAKESGHFELAVDKAIFEAAQHPGERERYVAVIHDLASKSLHATEQEIDTLEKEGHQDLAAPIRRRIMYQKLISERSADVIDVATRFYSEKLVGIKESATRETREKKRQETQREERRIEAFEKERRVATKQERKGMGREERKEAKRKEREEEVAAQERRSAREKAKMGAANEARQIEAQQEAARELRKEERKGS